MWFRRRDRLRGCAVSASCSVNGFCKAALIEVAQLVEHQAKNLTVTGSTPVSKRLVEKPPPKWARKRLWLKLAGNSCLILISSTNTEDTC